MTATNTSWASSPGSRRSMQSNRRRDTNPELLIRSAIHQRGLRYRTDFRIVLEGGAPRPDIAFTRRRLAIFVDGCFWHLCAEHCVVPRGDNAEYWRRKLEGNKRRDDQHNSLLQEAGWTVLRIWEHEPVEEAVERIIHAYGDAVL